jgi:predicted permease
MNTPTTGMTRNTKLLWQMPLAALAMAAVGVIFQFLLSLIFTTQPRWDTSLVVLMAAVGLFGRYSDHRREQRAARQAPQTLVDPPL